MEQQAKTSGDSSSELEKINRQHAIEEKKLAALVAQKESLLRDRDSKQRDRNIPPEKLGAILAKCAAGDESLAREIEVQKATVAALARRRVESAEDEYRARKKEVRKPEVERQQEEALARIPKGQQHWTALLEIYSEVRQASDAAISFNGAADGSIGFITPAERRLPRDFLELFSWLRTLPPSFLMGLKLYSSFVEEVSPRVAAERAAAAAAREARFRDGPGPLTVHGLGRDPRTNRENG